MLGTRVTGGSAICLSQWSFGRDFQSAGEKGRPPDDAPVDLVFSDVNMPGPMDGLGLARWLHNYRPEVPVILTAPQKVIEAKALCEEVGETVLSKPSAGKFDALPRGHLLRASYGLAEAQGPLFVAEAKIWRGCRIDRARGRADRKISPQAES